MYYVSSRSMLDPKPNGQWFIYNNFHNMNAIINDMYILSKIFYIYIILLFLIISMKLLDLLQPMCAVLIYKYFLMSVYCAVQYYILASIQKKLTKVGMLVD